MAVKDDPPLVDEAAVIAGLCCKLLAVEELGKAAHVWCRHFQAGSGCAIYAGRPDECRSFRCLWLMRPQLGPEWQPSRSRIVLFFAADGSQLVASVDPGYPTAWRRSPYFGTLRGWAARGLGEGLQVLVKVGGRVLIVLPDREVDLGNLAVADNLLAG